MAALQNELDELIDKINEITEENTTLSTLVNNFSISYDKLLKENQESLKKIDGYKDGGFWGRTAARQETKIDELAQELRQAKSYLSKIELNELEVTMEELRRK